MIPQVSCVSGTINRLPLLRKMVASVRRSVEDLTYEIILVDCNSQDGTRDWIRKQRDCVLLERPGPKGSADAFQVGFRAAKADSVVTLNDDIIVDRDSIARSHRYMQRHPEVGQVAFAHRYQARGAALHNKDTVLRWFGYPFAQCGMTRKFLGDALNWCGDVGYISYAWDAHLGMGVWKSGYKVVPLQGCSVTDYEYMDETRQKFSDDMRNANKGKHPDNVKFFQLWTGVLPPPKSWVAAPTNSYLYRAHQGNLRLLRFKGMMSASDEMRHGMIDVWARYGPTLQLNQAAMVDKLGLREFQEEVLRRIKQFRPDIVMFQSQRPGNVTPHTARRAKQAFPGVLFLNYDGDTHYPLTQYHFDMAGAVDLQIMVSPTVFPEYMAQGVYNLLYWPISVEEEFFVPPRNITKNSPDVTFLGNLYGLSTFPEGRTRQKAVQALHKSRLRFRLHGNGWKRIGISATNTMEAFDKNPRIYAASKMALSLSQTKEMWGYSSDRLYNISAAGCPALIQRFAGMEEHGFVDGKTCIAWSTFPEMLEKAAHYVKHSTEREAIARAARHLMRTRHTWTHRVESLLRMLGGFHGEHV